MGVYDLEKNENLGAVVLHEKFEQDDHDSPVFYVRPDGSILAVWAKHGRNTLHYYAISDPHDYLNWSERKTFDHEFYIKEGNKWGGLTYMNLYTIENQGLLYNFFRDGPTYNPTFITSADHGATWGNRTHLIEDGLRGRQRPYARYAQKNPNRVGISLTEAHPHVYGTSLYYVEFDGKSFFHADGTIIKDLSDGPLNVADADKIYSGSQEWGPINKHVSMSNSAWCTSIEFDKNEYPHQGYSVYFKNEDQRYRLASWNGKDWNDREIAYAGTDLYSRASAYTGLIALDPETPEKVAISADVNPQTGGESGGQYEIYVAEVKPSDNTGTIQWEQLTFDSSHKNIRPIIVTGEGYKVLMWLSGPWQHFQSYQSDAVGYVLERP